MSDEEKVKVWMPLFIGAYLADTQRLSTEQHGAYLLLIMDYWMNGAPADDDEELAQITKLSLSAWKKTKVKIVKFFSLVDGHWFHKRIERELKDAKANKEKAVTKAKNAAEKRWGKHNYEQSSAESLESATSNAPSMLQALLQGEQEALLEEMHKQCPIPTPLPTTKTEGSNHAHGDGEVGGVKVVPMSVGLISRVMREFGILSNTADPRLIAIAEQGISLETMRAACEYAKEVKPNEKIPPLYVFRILEGWAAEASKLNTSGAKSPAGGKAQKFDPVAYVNKNRASNDHERPDDYIDV
jgi:uncharacterized protein YdaU (DUF1376 family)